MPSRWGRAGERLSADECERRDQAARRARNLAAARRAADEQLAYARWRAGLVCPALITLALDARGLYGPAVDQACGAAEPDVDQWEAGERYPTWAQLRGLARLTGFAPLWFCRSDVEPLRVWQTSMVFHMPAGERRAWERQPDPVVRYPRAVLDARPPAPAELPDAGGVDELSDAELAQLRERIAAAYRQANAERIRAPRRANKPADIPASAETRARLRASWRQLPACAESGCAGCLLCQP